MSTIQSIIFPAIDELNQIIDGVKIPKAKETVLLGPTAVLDSLDLVTLILSVEENIAKQTDISVTLADEKAMSRRHSPFRTVGTLAEYIDELIDQNKNGKPSS